MRPCLGKWNLDDAHICEMLNIFGCSKCCMHRSDTKHTHTWRDCPVLKDLGFEINPPANYKPKRYPAGSGGGDGSGN